MIRLLVLLFVPAFAGPALVLRHILLDWHGAVVSLPLFLLCSTSFGLGVSVPYAIAMELAFRCGLKPASWGSVLISALLGMVPGVVLGIVAFRPVETSLSGAVVGAGTAGMVAALSRLRRTRSAK